MSVEHVADEIEGSVSNFWCSHQQKIIELCGDTPNARSLVGIDAVLLRTCGMLMSHSKMQNGPVKTIRLGG
jgi:hypothetical protein